MINQISTQVEILLGYLTKCKEGLHGISTQVEILLGYLTQHPHQVLQ